MTLRIEPVMALGTEPVPGAGSLWVGQLEIAHPLPDHLELTDAPGFDRARLLLRYRGTPVVFAEVAVSGMRVRTSDLLAALPEHGRLGAAPDSGPGSADSGDIAVLPSISVVLCTRDRPDALRTALTSIARLRYPELEVVVVDNAASTRATHELVAALDDQRFRVVDAPVPGLARARNVGLLAARHEVVAFTDDDVVVDPSWLEGIARGFGVGVGVACVCGMVPSGELSTSAQLFFDRRVAWASSLTREVFSLADPRPGDPLFPFHVGRYGTGANFALRRETALRLGGFDEALGAGSPTGGGEDTDMFLRVLLAGKHLVYEPSALVWHRHRADVESLTGQLRAYGTGMAACLTSLACEPRTARMLARRLLLGIRHAGAMTRVVDLPGWSDRDLARLRRTELFALARGPWALRRARRAGARRAPLLVDQPDDDPTLLTDRHLEAIP